jgi:acetyl-CoA acetyltransferase
LRRDTVSGDAQFTAPWGLGHAVAAAALPYSRYMARYGATREDMATFIVRNRANAAVNPDAMFFGQPLTRVEYLDAKMIAEPLSILDCDMPVDGCGALVLATEDRARHGPHPPAFVTGGANLGLPPRRTVTHTLDNAVGAAGGLARALWASSGLTPRHVTSAQLYDGYSWFTYLFLEAFGLAPEGEAFRLLQDDTTALAGRLPINTGGGALGIGRLHGMPQLIEAVLQVQGRAGSRQVADPSVTLVCTGGPFRGSAALTLSP